MNNAKNKFTTVVHPFAPVYDENSKILILGTMASPKSRELGFFYGHPQNNFWRIVSAILNLPVPQAVDEKRELLLKNNIALWDVLHSCDISGADDGSIKNPVVNDFSEIFAKADIKAVFTTGMTATRLYQKHCYAKTLMPPVYLPSTSPANRKYYTFEKLIENYKIITEYLK